MCFDFVSFGYDLCWFILNKVSFIILVGKMVVVVGVLGVGKLILFCLLFCFYDVIDGVIYIDD